MKTAALIIGIVSLCTLSSCKCDRDEEEPTESTEETGKIKRKISGNRSENDTLKIR